MDSGAGRTAGRRLGRAVRRVRVAPVLVDALLVGALFVATGSLVGPDLVAHPWQLGLQAGLLLPLLWRRRAPLLVFGAVAAVAFVQLLADVRLPADAGLLVALYTVAARRSLRWVLLAGAVLEAGILLYSVHWPTEGSGHLIAAASLTATAVAAAVLGTNMRTRRAYLATLEDRTLQLERERDQQAQLAAAAERAHIAREMHDIVSHNLSVMVALADGAVFAQDRAPAQAAAAMRQIAGTGRQALTDMRRLLGVLRADEPDALRHPMPGLAQLAPLAGQVRAAGLPTSLQLTGDPSAVPAAAQLTAYRLVQEALTNTLKHAPAGTSAAVRVHCGRRSVTVEVTDDGHPAPAVDPLPGHGIAGMRERVAAYGGTLTAGRGTGGWQVAARLNLTPTPDPSPARDPGPAPDPGAAPGPRPGPEPSAAADPGAAPDPGPAAGSGPMPGSGPDGGGDR
ncbi:MAG TPA: histidine kinase [Mycobacteriales bacterium]|nr:histidine kinase [Mycobacteriales bacterium]